MDTGINTELGIVTVGTIDTLETVVRSTVLLVIVLVCICGTIEVDTMDEDPPRIKELTTFKKVVLDIGILPPLPPDPA